MVNSTPTILYMSGCLPDRSETFVYREVFALRSLGLNVKTASVHQSVEGLGTEHLDSLAHSTIQIYSDGAFALAIDALLEACSRPLSTIKTSFQIISDACFSLDVTLRRRPKILWQGIASFALAKRMRGLHIKHIHAHMAHVPTTIAMYTARQLNVSFSFTGHANDLFPNRTLLKEKLKRASFVNCISYWHRDFYKTILDKSDTSLPVIRCGIDTNQIQMIPVPHPKKIRVVSIGRLVAKKGFDILIKAAAIIADRGNVDVSVIIAGGGPEKSNLQKMISDSPSSLDVELIGEIQNEKVWRLLEECDVFVLPCKVSEVGDRDGIPVVLMEAMSQGRCTVSGDLPTIRELITHNVSGLLIPPDNVEALVEILEEISTQPEMIDKIGMAARKKIVAEFDLRSNAKRILNTMHKHQILP